MDKLIIIDSKGQVLCLYADDLPKLGNTKVIRASHVEPVKAKDFNGMWCVKLAKIKQNGKHAGKYLGPDNAVNGGTVNREKDARWFYSRAQALAAEVSFIQHYIMEGKQHA